MSLPAKNEDASSLSCFVRMNLVIEGAVARFFGMTGYVIGRFPIFFLVGATLFAMCLSIGMLRAQTESEAENLWIPQNSQSIRDRAYIRATFGRSARVASVILFDRTGGNVLSLDRFSLIVDFHSRVLNISVQDSNGQMKRFEQLCLRDRAGRCELNGVMKYFGNSLATYQNSASSNSALLDALSAPTFPLGLGVPIRPLIFGGLPEAERDLSSRVTFSRGIRIDYGLSSGSLTQRWEERFIQLNRDTSMSNVVLLVNAERSLNDELNRSVAGDITLVVAGYVLIFSYATIVLYRSNTLLSKALIGFAGIFAVAIGTFAGFGLVSLFGVPFSGLTQSLPFILVGIAVDDMFIIANSYDHVELTHSHLDIPEKISLALSEAGTSITVTSLTDCVAFYLGTTSSLPAIRDFAIFAGTSILLVFLVEVGIFTAALTLNARRSLARRYEFAPCYRVPLPVPPSMEMREVKISEHVSEPSSVIDIDRRDEETAVDDASHSSLSVPVDDSDSPRNSELHEAEVEGTAVERKKDVSSVVSVSSSKDDPSTLSLSEAEEILDSGFLHRFLHKHYAPFILSTFGRIFFLILFAAFFGAAIWGVTTIQEGLPLQDLAPDGSYVSAFLDVVEADYQVIGLPLGIYFGTLEYPDLLAQRGIIQTAEILLKNQYIDRSLQPPVRGWWYAFRNFYLTSSNFNSSLTTDAETGERFLTNPTQFYAALSSFLSLPQFQRYLDDVILRNGRIFASRIFTNLIPLREPSSRAKAMLSVRDTMKSSPLSPQPFVFSEPFVFFEQDAVLVMEIIQTVSLGLVAVIVICSFLLIHPINDLIIFFALIMIDVELIGFFAWCGIRLNSISTILLIMSLGLSCDYTVHICHFFLQAKGNRTEKSRHAVSGMGQSVLAGGFTTFLGLIPLALSSSTIFRTFFVAFSGIITFALANGLIVVPILLSLFGPAHLVVSGRTSIPSKTSPSPSA